MLVIENKIAQNVEKILVMFNKEEEVICVRESHRAYVQALR